MPRGVRLGPGAEFSCEQCRRRFHRNQWYINRGHQIRFCSMECYSKASALGNSKRVTGPQLHRRKGQWFTCRICGVSFYRKPSEIARRCTQTCGRIECISENLKGGNNPFWGKGHSLEMRAYLSKIKSARISGGHRRGPVKGTFSHSPEARRKMSEALRNRWRTNRDKMLASIQKPPKPREAQRYRKVFTPWQRANWKDNKCRWCGSTKRLILDHIVSVRDGGLNIQGNSQTLCQPCNIWKSVYIDRPYHLARLALQGGSV